MVSEGLQEARRIFYDYIQKTGNEDAWQMIVQFDDGTYAFRTGFLDIVLGEYKVPSVKEPERLYNRDIKSMNHDELVLELYKLHSGMNSYQREQARGLRTITICKEKGAYTWDEWYKMRESTLLERLSNAG